MLVQTTGISRFRVNGPVTSLNVVLNHVVYERILPLLINVSGDMAPHFFFRGAGIVRPLHVSTELTNNHGISLITQITEVLFPTWDQALRINGDLTISFTSFVAFELGTFTGQEGALNKYRWTVSVRRQH